MSIAASKVPLLNRKLKEERRFWLERLSCRPDVSGLPPDHPKSRSSIADPDSIEFRIEGDLFDSLMKLTREGPFLVYTTLMAALKIPTVGTVSAVSLSPNARARIATAAFGSLS